MKKLLIIALAILFLTLLGVYIFNPGYVYRALRHVKIFSVDCPKALSQRYSKKLNDKMPAYIHLAKKNGISKCKDDKALAKNESVVKIKDNDFYKIDRLTHSYPYLTEDGRDLLDTIAARFQDKLKDTELKNTRFIITSLTRTEESVKKLRKRNSNASSESAHMYGECFDIAYSKFSKPLVNLKACHIQFLKETLASVLLDLKKEKECWALTEVKIPCFHVVCR